MPIKASTAEIVDLVTEVEDLAMATPHNAVMPHTPAPTRLTPSVPAVAAWPTGPHARASSGLYDFSRKDEHEGVTVVAEQGFSRRIFDLSSEPGPGAATSVVDAGVMANAAQAFTAPVDLASEEPLEAATQVRAPAFQILRPHQDLTAPDEAESPTEGSGPSEGVQVDSGLLVIQRLEKLRDRLEQHRADSIPPGGGAGVGPVSVETDPPRVLRPAVGQPPPRVETTNTPLRASSTPPTRPTPFHAIHRAMMVLMGLAGAGVAATWLWGSWPTVLVMVLVLLAAAAVTLVAWSRRQEG